MYLCFPSPILGLHVVYPHATISTPYVRDPCASCAYDLCVSYVSLVRVLCVSCVCDPHATCVRNSMHLPKCYSLSSNLMSQTSRQLGTSLMGSRHLVFSLGASLMGTRYRPMRLLSSHGSCQGSKNWPIQAHIVCKKVYTTFIILHNFFSSFGYNFVCELLFFLMTILKGVNHFLD